MLPREVELVSEWTGLPGGKEQYNGPRLRARNSKTIAPIDLIFLNKKEYTRVPALL